MILVSITNRDTGESVRHEVDTFFGVAEVAYHYPNAIDESTTDINICAKNAMFMADGTDDKGMGAFIDHEKNISILVEA